YLVQMPLVTRPGTPATELIRILLAKLSTPCADGFVRHSDATDDQELFHVTVTEREAEVQPDRVADDLPREPMMFVKIGWGGHRNSTGMAVYMRRAHSSHEELPIEGHYATLCRGWTGSAISCQCPWEVFFRFHRI